MEEVVRPVFNEAKVSVRVPLRPQFLANVKEGIKEHLNRHLLLRFSPVLGGVVLGYWNIKLQQTLASISVTRPGLTVCTAHVTILVLSIHPGAKVTAQVSKVGRDYIGLLLLGDIHVSIKKANISPEEFQYDVDKETWVSKKNKSKEIVVGSQITCTVLSIEAQTEGNFLTMEGSLGTTKEINSSKDKKSVQFSNAQEEIAAPEKPESSQAEKPKEPEKATFGFGAKSKKRKEAGTDRPSTKRSKPNKKTPKK